MVDRDSNFNLNTLLSSACGLHLVVLSDCSSSSHHINILSSRKKEGKLRGVSGVGGGEETTPEDGPIQRFPGSCQTSFLLVTHWSRLSRSGKCHFSVDKERILQ